MKVKAWSIFKSLSPIMGNSLKAVFENKGIQLSFLRWSAGHLLLEACDQLCFWLLR